MANDACLIIPETAGFNNQNLKASIDRLVKAATYKDCSTAIICPTRGMLHCRPVQSWFGLIRPMNQKISGPIFLVGMEVGMAYQLAFDMVVQGALNASRGAVDISQLRSQGSANYKYVLTLEDDNMPPPDGLCKLIESIEGGVDGKKYDAMGGLYWIKGEGGQPMLYGDPNVEPRNFIPQVPKPNTVQPVCGMGMGFTLFRTKMFTEGKLSRPWFRTVQRHIEGVGQVLKNQDLGFFEQAGMAGYKFAVDTRVHVGHHSPETDVIW